METGSKDKLTAKEIADNLDIPQEIRDEAEKLADTLWRPGHRNTMTARDMKRREDESAKS